MRDEQLICRFERAVALRQALLRRTLLRQGIHLGQPEMMQFVSGHPGCTQRQMADNSCVTPASIAASFKRMEGAGLIRRETDKTDTRCNRVYITEAGERVLADCKRETAIVNEKMLEGFSEEEKKLLDGMLLKIDRNLSGKK